VLGAATAPRETPQPDPPSVAAAAGRGARTGGNHEASLAAQQALLDDARTAVARGDETAALRALELHARRYPDSVMVEEREALAIKAFVAKGKYAEARARGDRFRTRFPRSLLLPSIDETLSTIP
jgi:outer membrane protein assembly factor BamD (BamD/ComL family)